MALVPLPTDIIKTMPPRGPLQQYRLASRLTFTCSRCGGNKVSRLITQQMLATAEAVTGALRTATGLDWSAAVIGLCKAVEIEVLRRVVEPLAQLTQGRDLTSDLADRDLARLARYCTGRAPAPEVGSLSYTLTIAARSERRRVTSPILAALTELVSRWAEGAWVVAVDGLATQTGILAREFRNPAAHTAVLTEADFHRCGALVQGENGLLAHLVRSTTP